MDDWQGDLRGCFPALLAGIGIALATALVIAGCYWIGAVASTMVSHLH